MKIASAIILLILVTSTIAFADGDHSAPATEDGAAKLLEDGDFTLSPVAEKRMGLQWETLSGSGPWKVPKQSIALIKFTKGVYRKFEGKITMVVLTKIKEEGSNVVISSPDLQEGDQVATSGVKYLRLTEVDISSGTVDNCSH